jgi:hypothetical protein
MRFREIQWTLPAQFARFALICGAVLGCGGSADQSSLTAGGKALPKVSIAWPQITREFNAPGYARSAKIFITPKGMPDKQIAWVVDRPSSDNASISTYVGPELSVSGPATLAMDFYSNRGGTGSILAFAATTGGIASDGTIKNASGSDLGTVEFTTDVVGVSVNAVDTIVVDVPQPIAISVTSNTNNNWVAIPASTVKYEVVLGADKATVSNGQVTAKKEGAIKIRVTVGSNSVDHSMYAYPKFLTARSLVNLEGNRWTRVNPANGKLYGTFAGSSKVAPNSIAEINPVTGELSNIIRIGSEPRMFEISADGTKAWVSLVATMQIRSVNLVTGQLGTPIRPSFLIDSKSYLGMATTLAINPENPDEVAVCGKRTSPGDESINNTEAGPSVYRNGVLLSSPLDQLVHSCTYLSGTKLVGSFQARNSRILRSYDVGSSSLTQTKELDAGVEYGTYNLVAIDGNTFTTASTIRSATTLEVIQEFTFPSNFTTAVVVDKIARKAWYIYSLKNFFTESNVKSALSCVDLNSNQVVATASIPNIPKAEIGFANRIGAKGLILGGLVIYDNAPGL